MHLLSRVAAAPVGCRLPGILRSLQFRVTGRLAILDLCMSKPIVLTILDGWGYRPETHGNAIALARKPVYDKLLAEYPNTLLRASDHFVGLP